MARKLSHDLSDEIKQEHAELSKKHDLNGLITAVVIVLVLAFGQSF